MVDPELVRLTERLTALNPQWSEATPGCGWRYATLSNGFRLSALAVDWSVHLIVFDAEGRKIEEKIGSIVTPVVGGCGNGAREYAHYDRRSDDRDYYPGKHLLDWLRPQLEAVDKAQRAREEKKLQESRRELYGS